MSHSVFVDFTNENTIFLYNTKNGEYLISHDCKLISLIKLLYQPKNLGVVDASFLYNNLSEDVSYAMDKRLIYLIDATDKGKPVNYLPILNLQMDLDRYDENGVEGRLKIIGSKSKFISGVYVSLSHARCDNNIELCHYRNIAAKQHPCPKYDNTDTKLLHTSYVKRLLDSLTLTSTTKVDFVCTSLYFECFDYIDFLGLLSEYNFLYCFHVYSEDINWFMGNSMSFFSKIKLEFIVYNDLFSSCNSRTADSLFPYKIKSAYLVYGENDLQMDCDYMLPVWTGNNIKFFSNYVWTSQSDIDDTVVSWNSIFRNQKLNSNFFGLVDVSPSGKVFPHGGKHAIGNIYDSDFCLVDIAAKELKENHTWRLTRNMTTCRQCPFRFICPPVSIYEIQAENTKMCNINIK